MIYSRGLDFASLKTNCIKQKTFNRRKQGNYHAKKSLGMNFSEILGVKFGAGIFPEILLTKGSHALSDTELLQGLQPSA